MPPAARLRWEFNSRRRAVARATPQDARSFGSLALPSPSPLRALTLRACGLRRLGGALVAQLTALQSLDLGLNEELGLVTDCVPLEVRLCNALLTCLTHQWSGDWLTALGLPLEVHPGLLLLGERRTARSLDWAWGTRHGPHQVATCERERCSTTARDFGPASGFALQLASLVHLTRLDLCGCGLVSLPAPVAALPSLVHLNLSLNALSGLPKQVRCDKSRRRAPGRMQCAVWGDVLADVRWPTTRLLRVRSWHAAGRCGRWTSAATA